MIKISDQEFKEMVTFIKSNYGINLINKRQLIESRMYSVLTEKGMNSFSEYFKLIKQRDSGEITAMLNKLTTNHTYFMREPAHFEFLKQRILPSLITNNKDHEIRIWSAGCSSGEEAYTTVMVIRDQLGMQSKQWDYRLLATDISAKVMDRAKEGLYSEESLKNVPLAWKKRYFKQKNEVFYELLPDVKKQVIFKYYNLMEKFSFRKPFDVIFCRNVMIYFDQQTKVDLVNKFYDVLKPGGYLFIGHSETIQRDQSKFKYVQPSIYRKGE